MPGTGGWWFIGLFVALPAVLIAIDLLFLAGNVWFVPWLALVSLIWAAIGFTVAIGFLPEATDGGPR